LVVTLTLLHRSSAQIWQSASIACLLAVVMLMHVYSWFSAGVVMAPTFILLSLAISCLVTNLAAIIFHRRLDFGRWKVGNQE
jgi:hypothetical protein